MERATITQQTNSYLLPYPRRRFQRGAARLIGKLLIPVLFRLEILGNENFPKTGPVVIVANHQAVMESVLLEIVPPWQVEMLGQADIPHEKITDVATSFFGYIPIRRGRIERQSLEMALDVLSQNGALGIYPEGGIWDAGAMRAQTGVSWLSFHGKAPVLPIGFSGTIGALGSITKFKRQHISMRIGQLIPPADPPPNKPRKIYFQEYATQVMEAIQALIPELERPRASEIRDEKFELIIDVKSADGSSVEYPKDLSIQHDQALTKVLHRPGILKIFRSNLELPTEVLEHLDTYPKASQIEVATQSILEYLREINPYLLVYRFGPKEAEAMRFGLSELNQLATWTQNQGYDIQITPIRRFYLNDQSEEIIQTKQDVFEHWM